MSPPPSSSAPLPTAPPVRAEERSVVIDTLKALASQIIVLHHLVAYGPLAEDVRRAAPRFIQWMYDYGRWAPQVFLVIAGYLLARGYAPAAVWAGGTLGQAMKKRYLRLILPYLVALILAVVAAAVVRPWLPDDPSIPPAPSWHQWAAHVALMQNVMGIDGLSAGVWYIAIDFQLFVLMAALLWLGKFTASPRGWPLAFISLGMVTSLLFFNRDEALQDYALYFFGTYSLGAMAYWLGKARARWRWLAVCGVVAVVAVALVLHFRGRLVLASVVASVLFLPHCWQRPSPVRWRGFEFLGRISYSLFLVHYPICLLANMVSVRWDIHRHGSSAACAVGAWIVSLAVAAVFHRWVEVPCARLGRRRQ